MKLRSKTVLIISLTLVILISILYVVIRTIVSGGFREVGAELTKGFSVIEQRSALRNVSRVTDALNLRIKGLTIKIADWAMWDDTYTFVKDRNQEFISSNISLDALMAINLNGIMILDTKNNLTFGMFVDLDKSEEVPIPERLKPYLTTGSLLLEHQSETSFVAGIIMTPNNPLMVVSRPITKSDGSGPINGSIIFARYLDDSEFDELSSVTHLEIVRYFANDSMMMPDFKKAAVLISDSIPVLISTLSQDTIAGYTAINDMHGNRVLLLRVDIERDIHRQGKATLSSMNNHVKFTLLALITSIIIIGIILGIVITLLLNKSVISRVAKLSSKTSEIGDSGDFNGRVEVNGTDELTQLSVAINKMLADLSVSHQEMESRNAEMRLLMKSLPTGLLSLDENYHVNPEFSAMACSILGKDNLAGMIYTEALGLVGSREIDGEKVVEFIDIMKQEMTGEATMASLNPFEELKLVDSNGVEKWIAIRYYLIRRGVGQKHHVLVVFRDISEEKRMFAEVARSNRENIQLKAIAEDPDLFREFIMETRLVLDKVELSSKAIRAGQPSHAFFIEMGRGVHTVKGVAGSFGLSDVVELAGILEDSLLPFIEPGSSMTGEELNLLHEGIASLNKAFSQIVESTRKILGDEVDHNKGIFLKIPLQDLKRYQEEIEAMEIEDELKEKMIFRIKTEALNRINHLQNVSARKGLARSLKIVKSLKERLGKDDTVFQCVGEETEINVEIAHELNTPLIHLIRNAFDHGIEDPSDRIKSGKKGAGTVTLLIERDAHHIVLSLTDDGKGIDCGKVIEKAIKMGICTAEIAKTLTKEECLKFIFHPGFTTKEIVSDVSGRGVGMDAVIHSIHEKLKGEVSIKSEIGKGSVFTLRIPAKHRFLPENKL